MNCATRGWPRNTWRALLFTVVCLVSVTPTQAQDAPDPVKAISNFFSRITAPANTSATSADKPVEPTTSTRAVDGSNATTGETRNLTVSSTGKRLALIIGNDNYQKVSKLQKAGNDATAMSRELKVAGFDTTLHKDLNYQDMVRAIEAFSNRINGGDQVVVFFAGHGVQIKTGSYLLPVDIEASSESQVERTAYGVADLTDKLNEAKASFALVMVDACRDNPLKTNGRNVGNNRGLSAIEPPKGQMVVYSASKGQQALDRLNNSDNNPNGIFTREFIKGMKKPGVKIQDLMVEVQDSVEMLAQTVHHEQRPAIYNESRGNFYFFGPTTVQMQGGNLGADPESETWTAAERSNSVTGYQAYLADYPKGRYATAAKIALDTLKQPAPQPVANSAPSKPTPVTSARPEDAETSFWNEVKSSASREYLDAYLKQYPKGRYLALAKLELKKLDDAAVAERVRQAAQRAQEEQNDWDRAKAADSEVAYSSYLQTNPGGKYAALANAAQQRLQRQAAERQQQATELAQREQRETATRLQREQRDASVREEAQAWSQAEAASSSLVVQSYLNKYPAGLHAEQAGIKVALLKVEEAKGLKSGPIFKDCADCPEMVTIPAGSFLMGGKSGDELPEHSVSIARSFAMGKTEVTQAQWQTVMGNNPSNFKDCGPDCPVEKVSWDDAQQYIQRLNAKTGKQYRLPSEAEWEYACRAGGRHEYCGGEDVNAVGWSGAYANSVGNSAKTTNRVATKQSNALGLYDMSGNVWEWTQDCWNETYSGAPNDGSAWTVGDCDRRVLRGGFWAIHPTFTRAADRSRHITSTRSDYGGFRLARRLQ